ncbi:esterase/lipase family protein [Qipengyuania algicida]|nr:alpha/beta fold hydrolase [Qipengyuania algicida]
MGRQLSGMANKAYRSASDIGRRLALAREPLPEDVRAPRPLLLLGELAWLIEPLRRSVRELDIAPSAKPQIVLMLPGFGAHPARLRYMARQIEKAGHKVKRWGQGFNMGATPDILDRIEERLLEIHERYGQKVMLVGWSLGGIYAREIAKRHPDKVTRVITMGTPFSGNPRSNNAWRAYQLVAGHRVDEPPIDCVLCEKPPVETVALWSPRDGVVNPRSACGRAGERDRAIALRCTHMGFVYSREAIETVLRELETI